MSSGMTFKGVYRYADVGELEAALDEVQQYLAGLVEADDFSLSFDTEVKRGDLEITVDIDTSCPDDWRHIYESVIETLAEHAIDGKVEATIEGAEGVETFPASAP